MAPQALLKLPIRLFWSMSRHVDRVRAEQELRLLDLHLICAAGPFGGQSKETIESYRAMLLEQRGEVSRAQEVYSAKNDIMDLANTF